MGPIYLTPGIDRGKVWYLDSPCSTNAYGRPVQSIDANINEDGGRVRYFAEMPKPCSSTEEWVRDVAKYLAVKANGSESSH